MFHETCGIRRGRRRKLFSCGRNHVKEWDSSVTEGDMKTVRLPQHVIRLAISGGAGETSEVEGCEGPLGGDGAGHDAEV